MVVIFLSQLFLFITKVVSVPEPSEYTLNYPQYDNPIGVKIDTDYSKNYFMLIGDWGAPDGESTYEGVQKAVANKMLSYYNSQKSKGYNLMFIIGVGDNFYWTGQDCNLWQTHWRDIYGELADIPWINIMGNHDWGNSDPYALCSWNNPRKIINGTTYAADQLNKDKGGCNPDNYYLPDFGYYYTINELSFEIIGLDENSNDCPNGLGGNGPSGGSSELFKNCGGSTSIGCGWLNKLRESSESMMLERAKNSKNKNFVIIQHYPGIGINLVDEFAKNRNNQSDLNYEQIVAAYGHTHSQQCDHYVTNGYGQLCNAIMTGGGGGCCGESTRRGFYVMGFDNNKVMTQPLKIDDDQISCWYPCGAQVDQEKARIDTCCHTNDDTSAECQNLNYTCHA